MYIYKCIYICIYIYMCVCVCLCVCMYLYKWSEVIHNTQSAQISQKQDGCNCIMSPSA